MARYLQIAADASKAINALMELVPEDKREIAGPLAAQIYNFGIRTAPCAVHSTVRLNAVKTACKNLPLVISMTKVTTPTGKSFNALSINSSLEPSASED
jgi:hypothetical protein